MTMTVNDVNMMISWLLWEYRRTYQYKENTPEAVRSAVYGLIDTLENAKVVFSGAASDISNENYRERSPHIEC